MGYNILIVDDSAIIRSVIKRTIVMAGIDATNLYEADSGVTALEVLGREWIDIVLADIHMPNMDGVELVRRMSSDTLLSSVPVVIVSSDRSEERRKELESRGIRAYIRKPFRPESIRSIIDNLMETEQGNQNGA